MRKELRALITAAAAGAVLISGAALAFAQAAPHPVTASSHGYAMIHGHRTACDTLIGGDVNGSHTRFHVSPITNTCNDQFRALDLCLGRTGSGTREYGPWVSGYNESNTRSCPPNMQVVEGATQFPYNGRRTYCLYGCSSSLLSYRAPAHVRPQLVAPGTRRSSGCSYSGKFNTDGSSFYSAALHTGACWQSFRGVAKCYIGRSTNTQRFYGPWRNVAPGASWSRGNCTNGDTLKQGGFQGSAPGTGARTTMWRWPSSSPAVLTAYTQPVTHYYTGAVHRCQIAFKWRVNYQHPKVWGESQWTLNLCGDRERTIAETCTTTSCDFELGGLVISTDTWSRATADSTSQGLQKAWIQDKESNGSKFCMRYFPQPYTNWFSCNDQP